MPERGTHGLCSAGRALRPEAPPRRRRPQPLISDLPPLERWGCGRAGAARRRGCGSGGGGRGAGPALEGHALTRDRVAVRSEPPDGQRRVLRFPAAGPLGAGGAESSSAPGDDKKPLCVTARELGPRAPVSESLSEAVIPGGGSRRGSALRVGVGVGVRSLRRGQGGGWVSPKRGLGTVRAGGAEDPVRPGAGARVWVSVLCCSLSLAVLGSESRAFGLTASPAPRVNHCPGPLLLCPRPSLLH